MDLLTTEQAAARLGVSRAFLERDRCTRRLVPHVIVGTRTVRYAPADLNDYIRRQTQRNDGDGGQP